MNLPKIKSDQKFRNIKLFKDAKNLLSKDNENKELIIFLARHHSKFFDRQYDPSYDGSKLFEMMGAKLKEDNEFLKILLGTNPTLFNEFPSKMKNEEKYLDIMLKIVSIRPSVIKHLNESLFNNDDYLKQFLDVNISTYQELINNNMEISWNRKKINSLTFDVNHLKRFERNPAKYYQCAIENNQNETLNSLELELKKWKPDSEHLFHMFKNINKNYYRTLSAKIPSIQEKAMYKVGGTLRYLFLACDDDFIKNLKIHEKSFTSYIRNQIKVEFLNRKIKNVEYKQTDKKKGKRKLSI
jgi:hypothetical protein